MKRRVHFLLVLAAVLAIIALGATAVVLGEADDSPGLQGIGVLVVIGAAVVALRWRGPGERGPDSASAAGGRAIQPVQRARCGSGRRAWGPR
jgi:hypothetical protein